MPGSKYELFKRGVTCIMKLLMDFCGFFCTKSTKKSKNEAIHKEHCLFHFITKSMQGRCYFLKIENITALNLSTKRHLCKCNNIYIAILNKKVPFILKLK
jgi:hypothetical protein